MDLVRRQFNDTLPLIISLRKRDFRFPALRMINTFNFDPGRKLDVLTDAAGLSHSGRYEMPRIVSSDVTRLRQPLRTSISRSRARARTHARAKSMGAHVDDVPATTDFGRSYVVIFLHRGETSKLGRVGRVNKPLART